MSSSTPKTNGPRGPLGRWQTNLSGPGGYVAFLLIAVAAPFVLTAPFQRNLLTLVAIYAIAAAGLRVVMGTMGQFSFGHAALWGAGSYASGRFALDLGGSPWLGLLLGAAAAGVIGWMIGAIALQRTRGLELAIITLGLGVILWIVTLKWDPLGGGLSGFSGIPSLNLGGIPLRSEFRFYFVALFFLSVTILFLDYMEHSHFGRAVISTRENEQVAASVGVDGRRYFVLAFGLSSAVTGLSGALNTHYLQILSPSFLDLPIMIMLLMMVLLGGVGSLWGPVFGSAMFVWFTELLGFSQELRLFMFGILVIILIRFMPEGAAHILYLARKRYTAWREDEEAGQRGAHEVTTGRIQSGEGPSLSLAASSRSSDSGDAPANQPPQAILETTRLRKEFGGLVAVDDLSMSLRGNEILGLIGPNGSGKTTTINMLTGFLRPSDGNVLLRDEDVTAMAPHELAARGLVRTFQLTNVFATLTVEANVVHASHLTALKNITNSPNRDTPPEDLLRFVGMQHRRNVRADTLSAGETRYLEMAIALAARPAVLLLDEPASGLNHEEAERLMGLVREIRSTGVTVLIVEHNMKVIMNLCDRIIVLNNGGFLAEGTPDEVSNNPEVVAAYLGSRAGAHE